MTKKHHVDTPAEQRELIKYYVSLGYKIRGQNDERTHMTTKSWGSFFVHVLLFLFTAWFSFGAVNIAYAFITHYSKPKVTIVMDPDLAERTLQ